jgi:hypothetical protein
MAEVKAITDLSQEELYELLHHLQQCNESAPEETRRMLQEQPEFARAIAQAQLKLGLIKQTTVTAAQEGTLVRIYYISSTYHCRFVTIEKMITYLGSCRRYFGYIRPRTKRIIRTITKSCT